MPGEVQLKKHQVRDPREVSRLICQFVDPFVKLGLLLLCVLSFYISGTFMLEKKSFRNDAQSFVVYVSVMKQNA